MLVIILTMTVIGGAVGLMADVATDPAESMHETTARVAFGAIIGTISAVVMIWL